MRPLPVELVVEGAGADDEAAHVAGGLVEEAHVAERPPHQLVPTRAPARPTRHSSIHQATVAPPANASRSRAGMARRNRLSRLHSYVPLSSRRCISPRYPTFPHMAIHPPPIATGFPPRRPDRALRGPGRPPRRGVARLATPNTCSRPRDELVFLPCTQPPAPPSPGRSPWRPLARACAPSSPGPAAAASRGRPRSRSTRSASSSARQERPHWLWSTHSERSRNSKPERPRVLHSRRDCHCAEEWRSARRNRCLNDRPSWPGGVARSAGVVVQTLRMIRFCEIMLCSRKAKVHVDAKSIS